MKFVEKRNYGLSINDLFYFIFQFCVNQLILPMVYFGLNPLEVLYNVWLGESFSSTVRILKLFIHFYHCTGCNSFGWLRLGVEKNNFKSQPLNK